jgi:hypothetical protein
MLLLAACRPGELIDDGLGYVIEAPPAFVGQLGRSVSQPVTLHSLSRSSQTISLSATVPFAVTPRALSLEGGASADVTVTFTPQALGAVEGTLTAGTQHVALEGIGVQRPVCADDGARCSTACVVNGTCSAGVCAGDPRSCDDGDACTVDLCDAETGCAHAAVQCPGPRDPCTVAFCDPSTGCATRPADDGTKCGDSDCTTSHVCLSGACIERSTPEGASCGDSTPCQDRGACHAGACERPAPHALTAVWTYTPPGGYWSFDFPGVADSDGNVYWSESPSGNVAQATDTALVSADRNGFIRYRTPLDLVPNPTWDSAPGVMQLAGELVLLTEYSALFSSMTSRLEARDRMTGALVWSRDVAKEEHDENPCVPDMWQGTTLSPPAQDGDGGVYVKVNRFCGNGVPAGADLVNLQLADGSLSWRVGALPSWGMVVADEAGQALLASDWSELSAFDRSGARLWRRPTQHMLGPTSEPLAVFDGHLVLGSRLLFDTNTGGESALGTPVGWVALNGSSAVLSASLARVFVRDAQDEPTLKGYDPATAAVQWSASFSGAMAASQPILTGTGATLVVTRQTGGFAPALRLTEIAADGQLVYSCQLQGATGEPGIPTLRHGRFTIAFNDSGASVVQAFDLPGEEPAEHGWVTAAGKMTKEGRPR